MTFAAAELSSVKSRADAMKAQWAKADDKSGNASLVEAERTSSNKAIAAQRRPNSQRLYSKLPMRNVVSCARAGAKSSDRSGANQGARIAEQS